MHSQTPNQTPEHMTEQAHDIHAIATPWAIAAAGTDVGREREANEDNFILKSWEDGESILAVVADGMGGTRGGAEASRIAVETLSQLLREPLPAEPEARYIQLQQTIYKADESIRDRASQSFKLMNMGTTIATAILHRDRVLHLHAGDCRFYHFHQGELEYVSKDHSVVQVLLDLQQIEPEDVPNHPMRSVVSSCLGGRNATGQFSIDPKWDETSTPFREFAPGDVIFLSSDGFHGEVNDAELEKLVKQWGHEPDRLVRACIAAANATGGRDNITAIAIVRRQDT